MDVVTSCRKVRTVGEQRKLASAGTTFAVVLIDALSARAEAVASECRNVHDNLTEWLNTYATASASESAGAVDSFCHAFFVLEAAYEAALRLAPESVDLRRGRAAYVSAVERVGAPGGGHRTAWIVGLSAVGLLGMVCVMRMNR